MSKLQWNFIDDLHQFDLGKSGAELGVWRGCDALRFEGGHCYPVLLREPLTMDCFLLRAEIACTPESFAGLVFGAADSNNFELVYVSADNEWNLPNVQYDPVMNGSSTWQIYHGPRYQALAPVPSGEWVKLSLKVETNRVTVYIGEDAAPKLVIPNLMHGSVLGGKIGVWGSSSSYLRNLSVEKIEEPNSRLFENAPAPMQLADETLITEWMVSKPYNIKDGIVPGVPWIAAQVEENGTLNLNRLYTSAKGAAVQAKCSFYLSEEKESLLSFGFSDRLRLWVNETEFFKGEWKWHSSGKATDGRIRFDHVSVPIRWQAGLNTIRAEIVSDEVMFGWGISVKTRLSGLTKNFILQA
ncbi:hypothetical protein [Paenibacillus alkalitolerans]|uniref:hypothetical protein n=1 Tax=Paenibacillus alkalitolerans TaxID=2799335 RepID=UPI0018F528EE|nr:hypothetical protein [Paenibacillus alkalitolerans]